MKVRIRVDQSMGDQVTVSAGIIGGDHRDMLIDASDLITIRGDEMALKAFLMHFMAAMSHRIHFGSHGDETGDA